MNRVLVLAHADCGHVLNIAADGTNKQLRAGAEQLLALLHAAGYTRFRLRSMDSIKAAHGILAPSCEQCAVDQERVLATSGARDLAARIGRRSNHPLLEDQ